jgi:exodeoxyribonuclease-5
MSKIVLNKDQEAALNAIREWYEQGDSQVFMLAGYAGTGKTTIAKEVAKFVGPGILFASFTGKAAHVLMKTGRVPAAFTVHSLIYRPVDKCEAKLARLKAERTALLRRKPVPQAELAKLEKEILEENANLQRPDFTLNTDSIVRSSPLVVIDEYSMIDEQMGEDLLGFGCRVLALGDPGQLPPVNGKCFFTRKPDFLLENIVRQVEESPIIKLSKDVREGKALKPGVYGSSRMAYKVQLSDAEYDDLLLKADQVLVGKNVTLRKMNQDIRRKRGHKDRLPVPGDKLVCRRNNRDAALLNGQTWYVVKSKEHGTGRRFLEMHLRDEDGKTTRCIVHRAYFDGNPDAIDRQDYMRAELFDYGYAITVHRAQGSQWDNVVLIDEWHFEDREKWLYTGITRAADRITILR